MIKWNPFVYEGEVYDLGHLHPKSITYKQEAKDGKPERVYKVEVSYGLHCFTRGIKDGEKPEKSLLYSDSRESRVFDFQRYKLSEYLPSIIDKLHETRCHHTGKGNFFVIEMVTEDGEHVDYEMYFQASKSTRKGIINLYVQSAYVRDDLHASNRPKKKRINFMVILYNTISNIPIKIQR
jgi:hypothetical protein